MLVNRVSGNLIVSLLSTSNAFLFYLLFPRQMLMHANAIFWRFFEIPLFRVFICIGSYCSDQDSHLDLILQVEDLFTILVILLLCAKKSPFRVRLLPSLNEPNDEN